MGGGGGAVDWEAAIVRQPQAQLTALPARLTALDGAAAARLRTAVRAVYTQADYTDGWALLRVWREVARLGGASAAAAEAAVAAAAVGPASPVGTGGGSARGALLTPDGLRAAVASRGKLLLLLCAPAGGARATPRGGGARPGQQARGATDSCAAAVRAARAVGYAGPIGVAAGHLFDRATLRASPLQSPPRARARARVPATCWGV